MSVSQERDAFTHDNEEEHAYLKKQTARKALLDFINALKITKKYKTKKKSSVSNIPGIIGLMHMSELINSPKHIQCMLIQT